MIGNFPTKKDYNPGGYNSFTFTPYQYIASVARAVSQAAVTFVAGKDWLAGYATRETLAYTEDPQFDENGTCYNLTVAGFVPGDKPELEGLLSEMANQRFVVVLKDTSGILRLVGSPADPLEFTAAFGSGGARADQKGYTFKFTGLSSIRAPKYFPEGI